MSEEIDVQKITATETMKRIKTALIALCGGSPPSIHSIGRVKHQHHSELLSDFKSAIEEITQAYFTQFGPRISFEESGNPAPLKGQTLIMPFCMEEGVWLDDHGLYSSNETDKNDEMTCVVSAAWAYKREAGWDFRPCSTKGTWILAVRASQTFGTEESRTVYANLIGFAVLNDRMFSGATTTTRRLSHLWVAKDERRKGVGRLLVEHARRLGALEAETPFTADGSKLLQASWGDLAVFHQQIYV